MPNEAGSLPANDIENLVAQIENRTLADYTDWLIKLEYEDKECQRYPRFKLGIMKINAYNIKLLYR